MDMQQPSDRTELALRRVQFQMKEKGSGVSSSILGRFLTHDFKIVQSSSKKLQSF
jgi:hypothetical protein